MRLSEKIKNVAKTLQDVSLCVYGHKQFESFSNHIFDESVYLHDLSMLFEILENKIDIGD